MDRQTVINGLECCSDRTNRRCNHKCPYYNREFCESELVADALTLLNEQKQIIDNLNETVKNLLQQITETEEYMTPYGKVKDAKAYAEMLKDQEPVEPTFQFLGGIPWRMLCGSCRQTMTEIDVDAKEPGLNWLKEMFHFCQHCGRPVKWG